MAYPGVGLGGPRPDQLEIMTEIIGKYIIVIYMKLKIKSRKSYHSPLVDDFLICTCSFKKNRLAIIYSISYCHLHIEKTQVCFISHRHAVGSSELENTAICHLVSILLPRSIFQTKFNNYDSHKNFQKWNSYIN